MFSIAVSLPIRDIIKVRHRIWLSCLAISLKTKKIKRDIYIPKLEEKASLITEEE